jgi:pimeloyl-ACP methyl ester carboxylesterase
MPDVETDLRIHYERDGAGPPVVWHTGGCGDGQMWSLGGYLTGLPGFTHIAIDHRGRGRSDAPLDMSGHQMACYVADVVAVLDDAGIDRAAFVGYSFGARVGFATAMSAPERLSGLVALDSYPDPSRSPEAVRAEAAEVLARGTRDIIAEFVTAEREPVPEWLVEHLCETSAMAFAGAIEAEATEPDLWAAPGSLAVPLLVVLGLGDGGNDPVALRLIEAMPHASLVGLDVAHLAAFHRTDLTLPLLETFLAKVGGVNGPS